MYIIIFIRHIKNKNNEHSVNILKTFQSESLKTENLLATNNICIFMHFIGFLTWNNTHQH